MASLFNNEKEDWYVFDGKDNLNRSEILRVWMDFGDLFLMKDIKIWRKIDFRKPDYFSEDLFPFLKNFNVELSEDNKNWFMVASEKGFEVGGRYFYDLKLKPRQARYVRLNVFSENLKYLLISEIEVFGEKVGNPKRFGPFLIEKSATK